MGRAIRVLIVDSSRDFITLLKSAMGKTDDLTVVGSALDGNTAYELVKELLPDVLVTDLILPGTDGLSMLRRLFREDIMPTTMVVSGFVNEYMARALSLVGVQVYLSKPFITDELFSDLREIAHQPVRRRLRSFDGQIQEALKVFGIRPHLHGRTYLQAAVSQALDDPGVLHGITKLLYPELGKQFSTTAICVERSIRSAIRSGWNETTPAERRAYFGALFDDLERPPGNARFIAAIAEHIRSTYERINPCSPPRERSQWHFYN